MPNGAQYQSVQTGYKGPWVDDVLTALGAPTTDSNRAALRAWAASEGTVSSNNPLAFSGSYPGATTCIAQCGSSSPIMAYNSPSQGAQNTAAFILNNSSYASIVSAFRSDAGLQNIWAAINSSSWCAGCQSGSYPTALHAAAGGATGGSAVAGGGASGNAGTAGSTANGFNPNAPAFSLPILGTILSQGQELKIKGWTLMIAGGGIAVIGLAVILANLGLSSKAGKAAISATPVGRGAMAAGAVSSAAPPPPSPSRAFQGGMAEAERRETDERRQAAEAASGPIGPRGGIQGQAERRRRGTSVPGARPRPRPGSRENRERAEQPF